MGADEIRNVLKTEYGIENDDDFYTAEENAPAIMIGLFTTPVPERRMAKCVGRRQDCSLLARL